MSGLRVIAMIALGATITSPGTALADRITSANAPDAVYESPPILDVSCPNGSYVASINYATGSSRNSLTLTCGAIISTDASPPTAPSLANCQACIIAPDGARTLDGAESSAQGQCVYVNWPGGLC